MDQYFVHRLRSTRHMIDITPGPRWRRVGRALIASLVLAIVFPLLWLLGGLLLLGLLAGAIALLVCSAARQRWSGRHAVSRRIHTVDMR